MPRTTPVQPSPPYFAKLYTPAAKGSPLDKVAQLAWKTLGPGSLSALSKPFSFSSLQTSSLIKSALTQTLGAATTPTLFHSTKTISCPTPASAPSSVTPPPNKSGKAPNKTTEKQEPLPTWFKSFLELAKASSGALSFVLSSHQVDVLSSLVVGQKLPLGEALNKMGTQNLWFTGLGNNIIANLMKRGAKFGLYDPIYNKVLEHYFPDKKPSPKENLALKAIAGAIVGVIGAGISNNQELESIRKQVGAPKPSLSSFLKTSGFNIFAYQLPFNAVFLMVNELLTQREDKQWAKENPVLSATVKSYLAAVTAVTFTQVFFNTRTNMIADSQKSILQALREGMHSMSPQVFAIRYTKYLAWGLAFGTMAGADKYGKPFLTALYYTSARLCHTLAKNLEAHPQTSEEQKILLKEVKKLSKALASVGLFPEAMV
jgi:hypothetical protein